MNQDLNVPEFLLCDDPIYDHLHDDRLFILHTQIPLFLVEVIHSKELNLIKDDNYFFQDENCIFNVVYLKEKIPDQNINVILKRMAKWYSNYLVWLGNEEKKDDSPK